MHSLGIRPLIILRAGLGHMCLYKLGIEKPYEHLKFKSVLMYECVPIVGTSNSTFEGRPVLNGHFSEIGDGFLTVTEFEHSRILDVCTSMYVENIKIIGDKFGFHGYFFFWGWFFPNTRCLCSLSDHVDLCTKGLCCLIVTLSHSHVQPDTCLVLWTLNHPKSTHQRSFRLVGHSSSVNITTLELD